MSQSGETMFRFRERLENYFVRASADLLGDLADARRDELAAALARLELREFAAHEGDRRSDGLAEQLEHVSWEPGSESADALRTELTAARVELERRSRRIEELTIEIAELRAQVGARPTAPAPPNDELVRLRGEVRALREAEVERAAFHAELATRAQEVDERLAELAAVERRIAADESIEKRRAAVEAAECELEEREEELHERSARSEVDMDLREDEMETTGQRLADLEERLAGARKTSPSSSPEASNSSPKAAASISGWSTARPDAVPGYGSPP